MNEEQQHGVSLTRRYHLDLCLLAGFLCPGALCDGPTSH